MQSTFIYIIRFESNQLTIIKQKSYRFHLFDGVSGNLWFIAQIFADILPLANKYTIRIIFLYHIDTINYSLFHFLDFRIQLDLLFLFLLLFRINLLENCLLSRVLFLYIRKRFYPSRLYLCPQRLILTFSQLDLAIFDISLQLCDHIFSRFNPHQILPFNFFPLIINRIYLINQLYHLSFVYFNSNMLLYCFSLQRRFYVKVIRILLVLILQNNLI